MTRSDENAESRGREHQGDQERRIARNGQLTVKSRRGTIQGPAWAALLALAMVLATLLFLAQTGSGAFLKLL